MKYMGFEGKIFSGAAGSEATNELENTRDITYGFDHGKGETTAAVFRPHVDAVEGRGAPLLEAVGHLGRVGR